MTATATARAPDDAERSIGPGGRRLLALLGLPTFAFALAVTVVTTYLPVVARDLTSSSTATGMLIAIEGLLALWLPLLVGTWSDHARTRIGGRLPFMLAGLPPIALGLALMALGASFGLIAIAALVFFLGYFVCYEPYRALYPDLTPDDAAGRAQSTQALWRGAGTAVALVGGGLLLGLGQAAPFLVAAAVAVAFTLFFTAALWRRGIPDQKEPAHEGTRAAARHLRELLRRHGPLRVFLAANTLWEMSLAALKTFVVLYLSQGLGYSLSASAAIIGGVSLFVLAGAAASGKLGDRIGKTRTMLLALPVYGLGLLVPFVTTQPLIVAIAAPFVAVGGGFVMTLPYAILMPLMPDEEHGSLTGFFSLSRGLGAMLGPLLGGVAVDVLKGPLSGSQGYQAAWLVCGIAALTSIAFVRRLRQRDEPAA